MPASVEKSQQKEKEIESEFVLREATLEEQARFQNQETQGSIQTL